MRDDIDEKTEGALYALNYEADENGWEPHIWAQLLGNGLTMLLFYATDRKGRTRYFDYATVKDTDDIGERVRIFERTLEINKAKTLILEGLERLGLGLDPVKHRVDTERLD